MWRINYKVVPIATVNIEHAAHRSLLPTVAWGGPQRYGFCPRALLVTPLAGHDAGGPELKLYGGVWSGSSRRPLQSRHHATDRHGLPSRRQLRGQHGTHSTTSQSGP
jgi:hypothetical protein